MKYKKSVSEKCKEGVRCRNRFVVSLVNKVWQVPPSPGLSPTCRLLLWHVGVTVRYNHIFLPWLSYYIYPLSVTIANTSDNEAAL